MAKKQTAKWKPTAKQQRFIEEYPVDFNGTKAAVRAKYSKRTAASAASRLLRNVNIQAAVAKQVDKLSMRAEVSAERVLAELARISFSDLRELFDEDGCLKPIADLPTDVAAAISSVEVIDRRGDEITKLKLWDKKGALELLGRHLAIFKDSLTVPITIKVIERRIVDPK